MIYPYVGRNSGDLQINMYGLAPLWLKKIIISCIRRQKPRRIYAKLSMSGAFRRGIRGGWPRREVGPFTLYFISLTMRMLRNGHVHFGNSKQKVKNRLLPATDQYTHIDGSI